MCQMPHRLAMIDHAEVGVELHGDDAERQARVLHAALDHHGAAVALGRRGRRARDSQPNEQAAALCSTTSPSCGRICAVEQVPLADQPERR